MIILIGIITAALSLFDFAHFRPGRGARTLQIHPNLPSSDTFSREASCPEFTKINNYLRIATICKYDLRITTIWEYYLRITIFSNSHHVKTWLFEKILFENVFWHQIIENGTLFENFEFSNSFRYYLRTWLFENFEFIIWE